jgi:hypothetical protein
MSILNHFRHLDLTSDQRTALVKIEAFLQSEDQVFILKGYAGSGKTTLIKGIIEYFKSNKRMVQVMAPTGRAAKVLRDKTGMGETIHKGIYNFEKLETIKDESVDVAEKSYEYFFPLKIQTETNRIAIVDETSMVSNMLSKHELFRFGSGVLLTDLLSYMQLSQTGNKIIFVGDPAQLPPVTDSSSAALNEGFFLKLGIPCSSFEMTQVARQRENSLILKNAMKIRDLLKTTNRNELVLEQDGIECIQIPSHEVHENYLRDFPMPEVGNGVIISYSNEQCLSYNQMVRKEMFPGKTQVTEGDILLINNNNYHTYGVELFNGDMAKVIGVSDQITTQTAPVYDKGVRINVRLEFRDIIIRLPHHDQDIHCKIIDSLLNSPKRDLTIYEMKALYINFVMRFEDEQKLRESEGLKKYKQGAEEFKEKLKHDPFFNALRVKYGYAITCHKAQGGEWEKTYVDFYGRVGLNDSLLRWCYTAITRASRVLTLINQPNITSISKLQFSPIGKMGTTPANAIGYQNVPLTPYHNEASHAAKRLKYFEVVEKISDTPFVLERVESREYQEMYHFSYDGNSLRLDTGHDAAGIFRDFKAVSSNTAATELIKILDQPFHQLVTLNYQPSKDFLETLYSKIQVACNELEIDILNIDEQIEKYFVNYFFQTSGRVSYIQFYFKMNGQFTTAMPKSDLGTDDQLLNELIIKLK